LKRRKISRCGSLVVGGFGVVYSVIAAVWFSSIPVTEFRRNPPPRKYLTCADVALPGKGESGSIIATTNGPCERIELLPERLHTG